MSFEKAAAGGAIDSRVAALLSDALGDGESVLVQETGDQGQSIILTNFRLIVIKIGLAATGQMDAERTAAYYYASISAVKLRRGPMGAVIQIVSEANPPSVPGQPPMNLVVFSGDKRIKHAEAIAEQIGKALHITIERIEPQRDASAHPAAPQTLEHAAPVESSAESDVQQPHPGSGSYDLGDLEKLRGGTEAGVSETEKSVSAAEVEDSDDVLPEEDGEFHANPRLPKPVKSGGMSKGMVVALIGALAALVVAGVAILGPMRSAQGTDRMSHVARMPVATADSLKTDLAAATAFQAETRTIIAASDASADALKNALAKRDLQAIATAARTDSSRAAIDKLKSLAVPKTMEPTREKLTLALDGRRAVMNTAEAYLTSGDSAQIPIMQAKLIVAARLFNEAQADLSCDIASFKSQLARFEATGE
jgi:hypothetical protein